jgi:hypothetical protein
LDAFTVSDAIVWTTAVVTLCLGFAVILHELVVCLRQQPKHNFHVVLFLPEVDSDPTVHFVQGCEHSQQAIIEAAAEKIGCSFGKAQDHLRTKPYYAFAFRNCESAERF